MIGATLLSNLFYSTFLLCSIVCHHVKKKKKKKNYEKKFVDRPGFETNLEIKSPNT